MATKKSSAKVTGKLEDRLAAILNRLEVEAELLRAVQKVARGKDYCDFFVENNNGGPFHEKCPDDPVTGLRVLKEKFSPRRMKELAELPAYRDLRQRGDDYPDFFVEGSGPPWHEKINDYIGEERLGPQLLSPEVRTFYLRHSNVIQTFTRIAKAARSSSQ
jgi:hypothetical protein